MSSVVFTLLHEKMKEIARIEIVALKRFIAIGLVNIGVKYKRLIQEEYQSLFIIWLSRGYCKTDQNTLFML